MSWGIPHPLAAAAARSPERVALYTPSVTLSYAELRERVQTLAGWLQSRGITAGQRVRLQGPATDLWVVAMHAISWLDACVVPTDAGNPDVPDAGWDWQLFARSGRITLCDRAASVVAEYTSGGPQADAQLPAPAQWALAAERVVICTSGSSGQPRAVPLSTAQLLFGAMGSALQLGHHLDDVWLCCLPLHHVGGLAILWRTAWAGTATWLAPRFDAAQISAWLDTEPITQVSLVPTQLADLLAARGARPLPERVRWILLGGAPCSRALFERAQNLQTPICLSWGMTETAAQVATAPPDAPGPPGSGVPPLPFAQIHTEQQRLVVTGPQAAGGRSLTDDRGSVDAWGRVHVAGRADRIIVSGGKNIDPERSERVLREHPAVVDACILPWPHRRWGQTQLAVVCAGPVAAGQPPPIDAWCRERLAAWHCPRHWVLVSELRRTRTGKLDAALRTDLARRLQTYFSQRAEKIGSEGHRPEGLQADAGVYVLDAGAEAALGVLGLEAQS